MIAVDQPSPTQSPKEQLETLQNSLSKIEKGVNRQGCQLLIPTVTDKTNRGTSSASLQTIPTYTWAIQASGGIICIDASLCVHCNDTGRAYIGLYVDGELVANRFMLTNGADLYTSIPFTYRKILTGGSHTVEFKWATTATLEINKLEWSPFPVPTSEVSIMELSAP